jgi:putative oxidoreductase
MTSGISNELILAARLLLATLFLIFGWRKLRDYSGTVAQMVQLGLPMPVLATAISIFMELITGAGKYSIDVLCGIAAL